MADGNSTEGGNQSTSSLYVTHWSNLSRVTLYETGFEFRSIAINLNHRNGRIDARSTSR